MVEKEFRRGFIARLLLFSASQLDGVQGSTTCGNCAANMTFGTALESSKVVKDREQRRQLHTNYVVDSGATLHCINDISLFDSIDHDHPPVKLRVANGKILVAHAVGTVKLKLQQPDGSITEVLLHNVVFHPDFSHNLLSVRRLWRDNRTESPAGGMTSMGIHALDMFINLFGRIRDVDVQSTRVASPIDVDDSTLVRLNFENGCTGHLTTLSATNMLWRISVYCLGGWVEIRDQDKLEISSIADGTSQQTYPGYEYPAMATIEAAMESFGTAIAGGTDFLIPPEEIGHATTVLAAIIESAESEKPVTVG